MKRIRCTVEGLTIAELQQLAIDLGRIKGVGKIEIKILRADFVVTSNVTGGD